MRARVRLHHIQPQIKAIITLAFLVVLIRNETDGKICLMFNTKRHWLMITSCYDNASMRSHHPPNYPLPLRSSKHPTKYMVPWGPLSPYPKYPDRLCRFPGATVTSFQWSCPALNCQGHINSWIFLYKRVETRPRRRVWNGMRWGVGRGGTHDDSASKVQFLHVIPKKTSLMCSRIYIWPTHIHNCSLPVLMRPGNA